MNSVYDEFKELGHINWTLTSIPTRYQEPFIELVPGTYPRNSAFRGQRLRVDTVRASGQFLR